MAAADADADPRANGNGYADGNQYGGAY